MTTSLDDANRTIREAVAARMAATPAGDPKLVGYAADGCPSCEGMPLRPRPVPASTLVVSTQPPTARDDLYAVLPPAFLDANQAVEFRPAVQASEAEFRVERVSASIPPEQLEAAWAGVKARRAEMLERLRELRDSQPAAAVTRLIGLTGPAGCGKTTVAGLVPDAAVIGFADPLYAGLVAILCVPAHRLRDREQKEMPIPGIGKSPRQLLQTLGTEWGRALVADDLWIRLASQRIDELAASGVGTVVVADVRFDNEAQFIRERGGVVWLVDRLQATAAADHVSEAGISAVLVDAVIDNTGTPEETRQRVAEALAR